MDIHTADICPRSYNWRSCVCVYIYLVYVDNFNHTSDLESLKSLSLVYNPHLGGRCPLSSHHALPSFIAYIMFLDDLVLLFRVTYHF
uniref:Uncharacterized protein n=1 Tax=Engystomops pustulosus TaxID=76066 RepID=A0AAV6YXA4_ENGPU|nr:hypothetical protein GDO81_028734 [Engystomops pustulosus]